MRRGWLQQQSAWRVQPQAKIRRRQHHHDHKRGGCQVGQRCADISKRKPKLMTKGMDDGARWKHHPAAPCGAGAGRAPRSINIIDSFDLGGSVTAKKCNIMVSLLLLLLVVVVVRGLNSTGSAVEAPLPQSYQQLSEGRWKIANSNEKLHSPRIRLSSIGLRVSSHKQQAGRQAGRQASCHCRWSCARKVCKADRR